MSNKIEQLIRKSILDLSAYAVPDAAGMIKLDAMENPFSMPEKLLDSWLDALRRVQLNRYPEAGAESLKPGFKKLFGISDNLDLSFGNGSDELIQLLCMAVIDAPFCKGKRPAVLAPEPGFVMYRYLANATGLDYIGVPLEAADFSLNGDSMLQAIRQHQPALVFLAYPNNPTGNLFDDAVIAEIIKAAPGLVIIDEAYQPFAGASYLPRLREFENVLLLRTVSKLGLAGLRFGALIGPRSWLRELDKLRLPYNISSLSYASMVFAMVHYEVFAQQARVICNERRELYEKLRAMKDVQAWPSRANFMLFRIKSREAAAVHAHLKSQGILLKNVSHAHPLLAQCLRVTVGSAEENQAFLAALGSFVSS
ncbi:MAG TPA: histidinol-phosphate transaminase [Gammaproteobacteria bacterium]|nr:histidinol-phosphate transaminase [Gammaproteobacteria bacterium]